MEGINDISLYVPHWRVQMKRHLQKFNKFIKKIQAYLKLKEFY